MSIQEVYDAFCETRFPPCTIGDIHDVEERMHVSLPPDIRRYLLEFNGGYFCEPLIVAPPDEEAPESVLDTMYGFNPPDEFAQFGATDLIYFALIMRRAHLLKYCPLETHRRII